MAEARSPARPEHPVALLASVSRLHIVAIASLGTLTFGWLFTGAYPWLLAAACALDWFVVNLLNRVVDLREDRANAITGTGFVERNRRPLVVLGFGVMLVSLPLVHLWLPQILWLRVGYHSLGLAYNWPLLPGGRPPVPPAPVRTRRVAADSGLPGRRRIKQLYFWKNTASAAGMVITVFLYPLATVGWGLDESRLAAGVTGTTILLSGAFFVLFELSYEVIYDLRDAPGDALAGVRTYAVVHGEKAALRIIDSLIAGSLVVVAGGYAAGLLPWRIFIMFAAPLIQLGYYKRAVRRGITAADCVLLTWIGAGLLGLYHVCVLLGIPGAHA